MEKIMEDEWSKSKLSKPHVFTMQILHHSEIDLALQSSSSKFCKTLDANEGAVTQINHEITLSLSKYHSC